MTKINSKKFVSLQLISCTLLGPKLQLEMNWLELLEKVAVASKLVIHKPFFKGDDHDVSFANLPFPHLLTTFRAPSPIYHSKQSRKRSVQVC